MSTVLQVAEAGCWCGCGEAGSDQLVPSNKCPHWAQHWAAASGQRLNVTKSSQCFETIGNCGVEDWSSLVKIRLLRVLTDLHYLDRVAEAKYNDITVLPPGALLDYY